MVVMFYAPKMTLVRGIALRSWRRVGRNELALLHKLDRALG